MKINIYMQLRQFLCFMLFISTQSAIAQASILKNAHAHNDYKHKHPLSDALQNGFNSIEADIFLINNKLIVSHLRPLFKKQKTLENLYLKPLLDSCAKNNGNVYKNCREPIILLIDIKSDAERSYQELKKIVEKYHSILTICENGEITTRAVTIILSGNKPYDGLQKDTTRYAFIDQSLMGMDKKIDRSVCLMASTKYSNIFTWKGKGEVPMNEKEKLISYVNLAHQQGKKVRLWASPENKNVWTELLNCGVDLINTDELEDLKEFLKKKEK